MRKIRSSGNTDASVSLSSRRAREVTSERLLDDDPAAFVEADRGETSCDLREHRRGDRHVVHGVARVVPIQCRPERLPGGRVRVVALDEVEAATQRVERGGIGVRVGGDDRVTGVGTERLVRPVTSCDPDHRNVEHAVLLEAVERREQLALGEIASGAEQDESVGTWLSRVDHRLDSVRSRCPPNPARIADSTRSAVFERPRELNR